MKSLTEFMTGLLIESEDKKIKELEKKLEKVEDKAEKAEEKADDAEKQADDAEEKAKDAEEQADDAEKRADDAEKEADKAEESIKSEEDFRDYAKTKFEEVFGDDLDEKQMKDIIDGILDKYKEDADKGDWGKLIGVLNKSFGS